MEYVPGRLADVFGAASWRPATVLLWHGMQPNARAVVRPLAELLARHGATVVVPDWNSHAGDGGRADLLQSVAFTRDRLGDGDGIALVGWSMGGVAAAGLTLEAANFAVPLAHTFCLAGAFMVADPISGRIPGDGLTRDDAAVPFTLLHGRADDAVPVEASRVFAANLEQVGWPVELVELDADHGTIAGADYDPAADRYEPATSGPAQAMAVEVAARIAATLGR